MVPLIPMGCLFPKSLYSILDGDCVAYYGVAGVKRFSLPPGHGTLIVHGEHLEGR